MHKIWEMDAHHSDLEGEEKCLCNMTNILLIWLGGNMLRFEMLTG